MLALEIIECLTHCLVLDCFKNNFLASFSTPTSGAKLIIGDLSQGNRRDLFTPYLSLKPAQKALTWKQYTHIPRSEGIKFSSILMMEEKSKDGTVPLILIPHGGPVTAFTTNFLPMPYFFAQAGFAVLLVNFRGSIGRGQESVDSLFGFEGKWFSLKELKQIGAQNNNESRKKQ